MKEAEVLARLGIDGPATLHDVAQEPASQRLKQLSDEVGRIAATLARLSTGRQKILARYRSYHGATAGSITLRTAIIPGERNAQ